MARQGDGVEPRGQSIRIGFSWAGERCRETLDLRPTPGNLKYAKRLVATIKQRIEAGSIERGYTMDMVYMALGKASKVKEKAAPEGNVLMWTFSNFYPSVAVSQLAMNDPSRKHKAPPFSTNCPGEGPGSSTAASISSTKPVGPEPGVDSLGSIPSETLHVLFLDGMVFQIKLEDE